MKGGCRDLAQQLVAGGMAERVVDDLEVVEVDVEHGGRTVVAAGAREREALRCSSSLAPVAEAGEHVVVGHVVGAAVLGGELRGAAVAAERLPDAHHRRRWRARTGGTSCRRPITG